MVQLFAFSASIFLGAGLGYLISREDWLFAIALALFVPLVVVFTARPFIGVGIWLVLMPLSTVLPNQQQLIYWGLHRFLITITLCVSLLPRLAKSSGLPRIKLGPPEICMLLLLAYVPLSVPISNGNLDVLTKGYLENILIPILLYFVMRLSALDHWKQQLLEWTALFIALSQSIIGLLSWFKPGLLPPVWLRYFQTRMCGSLLNPNTYAVLLVFCGFILFHSAMNRPRGVVRSGFLLICVLVLLCVFLTMERAVWLGTVVAIVGLLFLYPKQLLHYLAIATVIFAIIGASLLSEKIAMANSRLENQTNVDIRIVLMDAMFQMIQAKPIFGWGFGTINENIGQYYRQVDSFVLNKFIVSHNTYLTIFTELGLVGISLYLIPVAWLLVASSRIWRRQPQVKPERRRLLWILWLALLQHFIVSNFMDMRFFPIGLTLWWMNLGLIANLVHECTEADPGRLFEPAAREKRPGRPTNDFLLEDYGTKWQ